MPDVIQSKTDKCSQEIKNVSEELKKNNLEAAEYENWQRRPLTIGLISLGTGITATATATSIWQRVYPEQS